MSEFFADTLLVRGATCALGYAAIQFGKTLGCKEVSTTHKEIVIKVEDEVNKPNL